MGAAIPAIIGAVGTVAGGAISSRGSKKAASKVSDASDAASNAQLEQYYQTREDFAPWRQAGVTALGEMLTTLGLSLPEGFGALTSTPKPEYKPPSEKLSYAGFDIGQAAKASYDKKYQSDLQAWEAANQPRTAQGGVEGGDRFDRFRSSPGYEFQRQEGIRAIDRSSAARGAGGAQIKALADYATGLADQSFGKYYNRLASLAGLGQTATGTTAGLGAQAIGQAGQFGILGGQAQANNAINQANIGANTINEFANLYALRNFNRPPTSPGPSQGGPEGEYF